MSMNTIFPIVTALLLFVSYSVGIFLWKIKGYEGTDIMVFGCIASLLVLSWPLSLPMLLLALLAYGFVMIISKVINFKKSKNG